MEQSMKTALQKTAIVASTVTCALLSFTWSDERGVSLGIESARGADRPLTAGAPRHYRRSDRGYGLWAQAVAATTTPWIYDDYYCYHIPYTGASYYHRYPGGYCATLGDAAGLYGRPTLFPRYYGTGR
jgi:hypothetical protein